MVVDSYCPAARTIVVRWGLIHKPAGGMREPCPQRQGRVFDHKTGMPGDVACRLPCPGRGVADASFLLKKEAAARSALILIASRLVVAAAPGGRPPRRLGSLRELVAVMEVCDNYRLPPTGGSARHGCLALRLRSPQIEQSREQSCSRFARQAPCGGLQRSFGGQFFSRPRLAHEKRAAF